MCALGIGHYALVQRISYYRISRLDDFDGGSHFTYTEHSSTMMSNLFCLTEWANDEEINR